MHSSFAAANREAPKGASSLTLAAVPVRLVGGLVFVLSILVVLLIPVRRGVPV
jgi:hypothetical protein